jgi:hypothetical protein
MMARVRGGARWLMLCSAAVVALGALLVLAPTAAAQLFGWLLLGDAQGLLAMQPAAVRYILFAHAVLGSVLMGWGAAIWLLASSLAGKQHNPWWIMVISICVWAVPDTAYSLLSGFWQNALLNAGFVLAFAAGFGLTAGRRNSAQPATR